MPRVLFLHGNAGIGVCLEHRQKGDLVLHCPNCAELLKPSRLLFPVESKDYASVVFIHVEWATLDAMLQEARWLTVFGYSAGHRCEAVKRFGDRWSGLPTRQFDHLEVIDVADRAWLSQRWGPLAFQDHLMLEKDFYSSILARYPRRSCEVKRKISSTGGFVAENRIPRSATSGKLDDWLSPLLSAEHDS